MGSDPFDLTGRVAVVTGGAGAGYGRQIVEGLARSGATVVLTSRCLERAAGAATAFRAEGLCVEGRILELRNEGSIRSLVDGVLEQHGRIDILVNNAAHNILRTVEEMSVDEWSEVMAVNVTGTWLLSRAVAPAMKKAGGSIINISSIYGVVAPDFRIYGNSGLDSPLVYAASKGSIIQMTRYLAVYWAPQIRVNCISPGGLKSHQAEDFVARYEGRTPLRRMAGPEDLKGAILFLASDASSWVTGQNIMVDGGLTVW